MIDVYVYIALGVFGAALGSFAAASVWRLRAEQLKADAAAGEKPTKEEQKEVAQLARGDRTPLNDRSVCLHCGRQLAWYDMIPVVSWLAARGRCRTCKQPIGVMELGAEVLLGAGFMLSYFAWPFGFEPIGVVLFLLWLAALVILAIHWMYDARWFLLLDRMTVALAVVAALFFAFRLVDIPSDAQSAALIALGYTVAVLPGFYGLLYLVSRGQWIGFGDVKLLIPFAFMLPSWEHGVLLIFLANFIGCLALLPLMARKKLTRTSRVPFGPFLIAAFVITFLFGQRVIDFYLNTMLF